MKPLSHYPRTTSTNPVHIGQDCIELAVPAQPAWSLGQQMQLPLLTMAFLLANLLDIVMTWALLATGAFREANPLANFVLENWGMTGMIGFKLAFVAGVILIAQYIASQRLGTARGLLTVGTLMVGAVVTYSGWLFAGFLAA